MTNQEMLISYINQLSEDEISSLLDAVALMLKAKEPVAKPSAKELLSIFEGHIADGTLALCDGLRSYHTLPEIAGCTVKDCNGQEMEGSCFYHLNTANEFHSFIKKRYDFYRRVASKYINRYISLFSTTYQNAGTMIKRLTEAVLKVTSINYYHSNKDIKTVRLFI